MDREYRRALQEQKLAEEAKAKAAREFCPGCTSHGDCNVAERAGFAPGQHLWTGFGDEELGFEDVCDLCGASYTEVYP